LELSKKYDEFATFVVIYLSSKNLVGCLKKSAKVQWKERREIRGFFEGIFPRPLPRKNIFLDHPLSLDFFTVRVVAQKYGADCYFCSTFLQSF
jgi:hypothetical protein